MKAYFDKEVAGGYVIEDMDIANPWEYIYTNGDVLLRVDQYGVVNSQVSPPRGIMLFKRENGEKTPKWLCFVRYGDKVYCNMLVKGYVKPKSSKIKFAPNKAEYELQYDELIIKTEIFLPFKGCKIIYRVSVTNVSAEKKNYVVMPSLYPYLCSASIALWDKPEWYLWTGATKKDDMSIFFTELLSSSANKSNRKNVSLTSSGVGEMRQEYCMERYCGMGDFIRPDALDNGLLEVSGKFGEFKENNSVVGFQSVYATSYSTTINSGETQVFSSVLSMLPLSKDYGMCAEKENIENEKLLDFAAQERELEKVAARYSFLMEKVGIDTANYEFDNYINSFLPLQMSWVALLDRGWPTGMRGVRDASNDFMGMLCFDPVSAREILINLYSCERFDGWLPRQVSCDGAKGKHDLREYMDGGAYLSELLYEYLCHTKDFTILNEKVGYLDSDVQENILNHQKRVVDFYINPRNLGEHGICKINEGDWLDAVNCAGNHECGESVTISIQTVMTLKYMSAILTELNGENELSSEYLRESIRLDGAINKYAFNESGYYNSVFNSDGKWVFSDNDDDGEKRIYGVVNSYAIFGGVANKRAKSVVNALKSLKSEAGYKLFLPAFTRPIEHVGRIASGDLAKGFMENANVYNHGSNGFLARAFAYLGMGKEVMDTLNYILPFNQKYHPYSATNSAPYAVVNCYQDVPMFHHRGGMPFLTGTVAYAVRIVYNYLFGIRPTLDGVCFAPSIPQELLGAKVRYNLEGKQLNISFEGKKVGKFVLYLGGKKIESTRCDIISGESYAFIPSEELQKSNDILIQYID